MAMRSKDGKWSRPELRSTLCALVFSVCSTACGATNQETSGVDTPGEIDSQCSPSNTCEDGGDTGCEVTTKCEPADCGNKPNNCGGTIYCGVCTGDESCDWVAGDTGPAYDIDTYDVKSTTVDGHKVEYLLIPVDALGEGTPWSNWGEGEVHSNGRYYGSFGNHLKGQHLPNAGNAWLYEYDPATQKIRILADALFAESGLHPRVVRIRQGARPGRRGPVRHPLFSAPTAAPKMLHSSWGRAATTATSSFGTTRSRKTSSRWVK